MVKGKNEVQEIQNCGSNTSVSGVYVTAGCVDHVIREGRDSREHQVTDVNQLRGVDVTPKVSEKSFFNDSNEKLRVCNQTKKWVAWLGGKETINVGERYVVLPCIRLPKGLTQNNVFSCSLKFDKMSCDSGVGGERIGINPKVTTEIGGVAGGIQPAVRSHNNRPEPRSEGCSGGKKRESRWTADEVTTGTLTGS
jgi:hypothetical protein